jgi:hypothetical protein
MHEWKFTAASMAGGPQAGSDVALLVAACKRCGLIRSEVAAPRREVRIDLRGDCPEAEEQPAKPKIG